MTRCVPALRKYHCPGHRGRAAEQLSVDEVADASQSQANRNSGTDEIGDFPEIPMLPVCDPESREDHADESAMKRHAALPDRENRQRLANVAREIVEENVTQPRSEEHTSELQSQFHLVCRLLLEK